MSDLRARRSRTSRPCDSEELTMLTDTKRTSTTAIRNIIGRASVPMRWISLVAVLMATFAAHAQFESASVLGYIKDQSGAAVVNANVTLTNTATGIAQTKQTDAEGKYEFPSVQIGNYQIIAEAQGFDKAR